MGEKGEFNTRVAAHKVSVVAHEFKIFATISSFLRKSFF